MLKIKLFCAGGMSTSMLVKKMEEAAAVKGMEVQIAAYPEAEMEKETNDCDIALLGPQVGYRLKAAEQICKPKNIPVRNSDGRLRDDEWKECIRFCIKSKVKHEMGK